MAILWLILSAGLLLRLLALDWGLPPRAAGLRSSYAMDEDNILEALSRTDPGAWDFDPKLYHWGTLHLSMTLAALELAETAGFIGEPWREAYERTAVFRGRGRRSSWATLGERGAPHDWKHSHPAMTIDRRR